MLSEIRLTICGVAISGRPSARSLWDNQIPIHHPIHLPVAKQRDLLLSANNHERSGPYLSASRV
jgi:hypothetical protein